MKTTSTTFYFFWGGGERRWGMGWRDKQGVFLGNVKIGQFQNTHFKIDAKCKTFIDNLVPGSDASLRASSPFGGYRDKYKAIHCVQTPNFFTKSKLIPIYLNLVTRKVRCLNQLERQTRSSLLARPGISTSKRL